MFKSRILKIYCDVSTYGGRFSYGAYKVGKDPIKVVPLPDGIEGSDLEIMMIEFLIKNLNDSGLEIYIYHDVIDFYSIVFGRRRNQKWCRLREALKRRRVVLWYMPPKSRHRLYIACHEAAHRTCRQKIQAEVKAAKKTVRKAVRKVINKISPPYDRIHQANIERKR